MPKLYDAAQGMAFLVSQLTHIESKMYETEYQHINYNEIIPVSNEAGEYATSVTYYYLDGAGAAKFVGSKSLDVPIANYGTQKLVVPVELGAIGYEYSHEELRQAIQLGQALTEKKAGRARRAFEEHAQRVAMYGDTEYGLTGFINNTNITAANVVNPGSGTAWTAKTADQIIFDVNDVFGDIFEGTKMIERANKLLLPPSQYNYIWSTPRATNSDTSIAKWLIANSAFLSGPEDIVPVNELAGAGAGSTNRMVAYTKDPDKVVFHMPMPLRFYNPQELGRGFQVPGEYKISGVEFRYPGSAQYRDGI